MHLNKFIFSLDPSLDETMDLLFFVRSTMNAQNNIVSSSMAENSEFGLCYVLQEQVIQKDKLK